MNTDELKARLATGTLALDQITADLVNSIDDIYMLDIIVVDILREKDSIYEKDRLTATFIVLQRKLELMMGKYEKDELDRMTNYLKLVDRMRM